MTTPGRRSIVELPAVLSAVGAAGLVALTLVLYLVNDGPWPAATLLRACVVMASGASVAWMWTRPRPTRALAPHLAYALSLGIVVVAAGGADASRELWRQAAFLAVLAAAAAPLPISRGAVVGVHIGGLLLVWLQLAGPRSGFDTVDRAGFYHALEQWSGYPELGLLMAVAACAMIAFACAARPPLVRVAAALLAFAFAAGTVFLRSRSAVLTVPLVAAWLFAVAAVKWRSKAAAVALALGLVGATVVAVRAGGVGALMSRAADSVSREAAIRERGWRAASGMFADHPIVGVGLGGYQREYHERRLGTDSPHAYNIVLQVLAESGLVGLLGWLALWGRVLYVGVRHAAPTPRGAAIFALHGILVAFLVRSQSEHFLANLMTSDRVLLLVALWMGLTEGLALDARGEQRRA
ncbi:MAG: O-antigen ligase family protein [Vicinamibacteraceae bacterium]